MSPTPHTVEPSILEGEILDTVSREPVAEAEIAVAGLTVRSDSSGRFQIELDGGLQSPVAAHVAASGFVTRNTHITWPRQGGEGVTIDLIALQPPFSLNYYRQFARDRVRVPEFEPLYRWSGPEAPKFYIKTTDNTGRVVLGPDELRLLRRTIVRTVPRITDGLYEPTVIETGSEGRSAARGWIRIVMQETIRDGEFCGFIDSVGANPGTIRLAWRDCGCGSGPVVSAALVAHELGHAMGFYHTEQRGLMFPTVNLCQRDPEFSAREIYHATIAYRRPRLNRDPDNDPVRGALTPSGLGERSVACGRPMVLAPFTVDHAASFQAGRE